LRIAEFGLRSGHGGCLLTILSRRSRRKGGQSPPYFFLITSLISTARCSLADK
jgi:hypothetical protein